MKKEISLLALLVLLASCQTKESSNTKDGIGSNPNEIEVSGSTNDSNYDDYEVSTGDISSNDSGILIDLTNKTVTNNDGTVSFEGNNVFIYNEEKAEYQLTGTLNGSVFISGIAKTNLILNGVDITSIDNSAIYKIGDKSLNITLADNSINKLKDSTTYSSTETNACLFSKDSLKIGGNGTLVVVSNYNNAIGTKDELEISSGTYNLEAKNNAIKGNDYVLINDGSYIINSSNDGIKSDNTVDENMGYIQIENGSFEIKSTNDALDSSTSLLINNGTFNITTNNGSSSLVGTDSYKGIKASTDITINNGTFNINSNDDAIHAANININGGEFGISSGDDGIHADTTLNINNANIKILKSYEGIEATTLNLNADIFITSSDDGINAAGGDGSTSSNNRPGGWNPTSSGNGLINITGGTIVVDSTGDGLDANGSITMSDGTVIVNGPTDSGNGALDYDSTFNMSGGLLIAAGSSGMAQNISSSSSVCSISITSSNLNQLINISDSQDNEIITFSPSKSCSNIVIASSSFTKSSKYNIYLGGSHTGTLINGIYSNGSYTKGSLLSTVTLSNTITSVGSQSGTNPGGMGF